MGKIKIGILDYSGILMGFGLKREPFSEIQILKDKIEDMGHKMVSYGVEQCQLFFHGRKFEVLQQNKPIELCDVLIPRLDLVARTDLEVSLIKQFQLMNIPVVNRYMPTLNAKNKLRTMQILSKKGIPVPKTIVVRKFEYLDAAIEAVGGYPVILKSPFGSFGVGVIILESRRSLYSALDFIVNNVKSNMLMIQEYVAEADGSDFRAFVVGDRVVAAMRRTAKKGDFRSNLHLGGEASKVVLTKQEQSLAVKAMKALGLQVAGVDLLRSKKGPMVMEVNSNPGFVGLTNVTGIDVAKEIVKYAVQFAREQKSEV
jgi:ribosomal protein S6--L-glutamate ligase